MYARLENNGIAEFPIDNIRQRLPNVSFPDVIRDADLPEGFVSVAFGRLPSFDDKTQRVVSADTPEQIGGKWVLPYLVVPHEPVPAPIVPVSPRQIRQAMTRAGIRQQVEDAIAASNDYDLKDWYEYATEFERGNPAVAQLAAALNISEQQLDDLWRLAATL